MRLGAELRSLSPVSPSARQRASHLAAHRSLIPAAAAASISDQCSSSILLTSRRLELTHVLALAWIFIRFLLEVGGFSTPSL